MSEIQTIIETVGNQAASRQIGCLTMRSEQILVDEIERLHAAKRGALAVADERAKEAVGLRAENERLRAERNEAYDQISKLSDRCEKLIANRGLE